jgi:hypothetical protein
VVESRSAGRHHRKIAQHVHHPGGMTELCDPSGVEGCC